jgi:hypothetical protein
MPGHYSLSILLLRTRFGDWLLYPETGTSPIYWTQLSKFHLKAEKESSLRKVVLNETQDNNSDSYINIP